MPRYRRASVERTPAPKLSPAYIAVMVERVIAGQLVQPDDVLTFCEVLRELKARGYRLAERSEIERHMQPWVFKVTKEPVPTIGVSGSNGQP
jgi:hypothetical protein